MITNNPLLDAVPSGGTVSTSAVLAAYSSSFALVVTDAAAIENEDFSATPYRALIFSGAIFEYDETDATTAHDGVSCIVVSGRRYKKDLEALVTKSVLDRDLVAQPADPNVGDAYILPPAPTGDDWAAKAKHYGIWTKRGWLFVAPVAGMFVYVADENAYCHYDGAAWVIGLGDLVIADGAIDPAKLLIPFGLVVEDQRNDPPANPQTGLFYIVGTAPTGQWLTDASAQKIAYWKNNAWQYLTGYEGATIYDKGAGLDKRFLSGAWSSDAAAIYLVDIHRVQIPETISPSNPHNRGATKHKLLTRTFNSASGDSIRILVDRLTVGIALSSGGASPPGITIAIRIDDQSVALYSLPNTTTNLDADYTDIDAAPTGEVWASIADNDAHELTFDVQVADTGQGSTQMHLRAEISATIEVVRRAIQTDGIL